MAFVIKNDLLESVETPCYIINSNKLRENVRTIMDAFQVYWGENTRYGYSVKTNHNDKLIEICTKEFGWYVETVSKNEYEYAKALGYCGKQIILNGPCKKECIRPAIDAGSIINLDNLQEVDYLSSIVRENKRIEELCKEARIGLRVNFDLESICPGETTAGDDVSRFGICYENGDLRKAINLLKKSGFKINGLHMHTSTITRSEQVFEAIANKVVEIIEKYDLHLDYIDIGGGFFGGKIVDNKPTMDEYAKSICGVLKKRINPKEVTLILEPGASIIATSVEYLTKVVNIREIRDDLIITVDGTVLHINPFMHKRKPNYILIRKEQKADIEIRKQTIVGATCMENDRFFSLENDSELKTDDFILFEDAGAYTMAFNSDFILKKPNVYMI